jgi:8-oxo-dGTP diphosphatase
MTTFSASDRVVVGAAIVSDGRVLAARRRDPADLAGGWEFPGGKVEAGETLAAACRREIREELGCEGEVIEELATSVPVSQGYALRLLVVHLVGGEPVPLEHDAIRWLGAEELDEVAWLDADLPFLPDVLDRLAAPVRATFSERPDAETVAALLPGALVVRDRFAGEDDDEDVAWVVEAPSSARQRLDSLAVQHHGWLLPDVATPAVQPPDLPDAPVRARRSGRAP